MNDGQYKNGGNSMPRLQFENEKRESVSYVQLLYNVKFYNVTTVMGMKKYVSARSLLAFSQ